VKATDNAHEIAVKKRAVFVMEEGQREKGRNVDVEEETAAAVEALEAGSWERDPPRSQQMTDSPHPFFLFSTAVGLVLRSKIEALPVHQLELLRTRP
jgi:hypothetical protein